MSITYTIPGLPLLNQLVEASNPRDDCVFTSSAAIATWRSGGSPRYSGTQLKAMDNNYGPSYVGFASAANLVDTLAKLGVKLAAINEPTQQRLIDLLHWQIEHYHQPCLITMPSQWNSAPLASGWNPRTYRGYSHVGVMCGSGAGMLRCMNPWGGFWQDQSDSWWAERLLEGQIWVATRIGLPAPATPPPASSQGATGASTATSSATAQPTVLSEYQEILALREEIARLKAARAAALKALS